MALFEKELARLEERQRQLGSAEKLLGMPGTVYPNLLKAQQDAKAMKQVYDIYAEQKVSVTLRDTHVFMHRHTAKMGTEEEAALPPGYCQL